MQLTEQELEIYSRQLLVSGWGLEQQLALKNSAIFLNIENEVAARYLIAVGIGRIFLKSAQLVEALKYQNPEISVELFTDYEKLPKNCLEIMIYGQKTKIESFEFETTDNEILDGILISSSMINKITARATRKENAL